MSSGPGLSTHKLQSAPARQGQVVVLVGPPRGSVGTTRGSIELAAARERNESTLLIDGVLEEPSVAAALGLNPARNLTVVAAGVAGSHQSEQWARMLRGDTGGSPLCGASPASEIWAHCPPAVELVEAFARSRASILIAGPGGSGKTTLLKCVVAAGDPARTICSIEDVRELALHRYAPAAIPLYAREENVEGEGAITHRKLVRKALRLRPDTIVVGECRGPEALDLLLAAATGHQCLGTIHSDSPRGALRQLATFARLAPEGVKTEALADMIAEHFDLVLVC